ncbi:MAG: hypothetical protein JWR19_2148 [Pedosphaera sp.]|nr:hypothetical protein [Pedosphaera sp.]
MSFGTSTPAPAPAAAGIQGQQLSTNQQAIPVAFVAGTRKIAVNWMCRVYNQRAVEAKTGGKK